MKFVSDFTTFLKFSGSDLKICLEIKSITTSENGFNIRPMNYSVYKMYTLIRVTLVQLKQVCMIFHRTTEKL